MTFPPSPPSLSPTCLFLRYSIFISSASFSGGKFFATLFGRRVMILDAGKLAPRRRGGAVTRGGGKSV